MDDRELDHECGILKYNNCPLIFVENTLPIVDNSKMGCCEATEEKLDSTLPTKRFEKKVAKDMSTLATDSEVGLQMAESSNQTSESAVLSSQTDDPNNDSEVQRKAKEDGVVDVVFIGHVTRDTCCRFVREILECVLYQRQQLPMPHSQLKYHYKNHRGSPQEGDIVGWRPPRPVAGLDMRKCQRTLQDLEEVLSHMDLLFSLTLVPRVLLILGSSLVLPKELYEINMEELALGTGDDCLRSSLCLRKLLRTLFVADILTDPKPIQLLTTTVMALGHRDCGVTGFRPKLDFKVPTRVKRQVIHLACQPLSSSSTRSHPTDWDDYVWFQAPVAIKGFCK